MAESIMLDKAKDFAVNIVNLCRHIKETKRESVLTNQLLRSGTSIGVNIHESKYGHRTADFVAKMQIALKECYESEYWLELLSRTGHIPALIAFIQRKQIVPEPKLRHNLKNILFWLYPNY